MNVHILDDRIAADHFQPGEIWIKANQPDPLETEVGRTVAPIMNAVDGEAAMGSVDVLFHFFGNVDGPGGETIERTTGALSRRQPAKAE